MSAVSREVRIANARGLHARASAKFVTLASSHDAAIEVHKQLGPGFREEVYENALCIEFEKRGLKFSRQAEVNVQYDGKLVGNTRSISW